MAPAGEAARFDAVRIQTDDLAGATERYAGLLGAAPEGAGGDVVRFALGRGAVELVRGARGVLGLRLVSSAAPGALAALEAARALRFAGVAVQVAEPAGTPSHDAARAAPPTAGGILGIDHVVVDTTDPARAIALWRDTLGIRLALDRAFPARGLRMLFFRSAGVTIEVVSPLAAAPAPGDDAVHGIAYRVVDVAHVRARLLGQGLDVSPVRDGNKRGTAVATVRSGTEGVPTLLIEAIPGDGGRRGP